MAIQNNRKYFGFDTLCDTDRTPRFSSVVGDYQDNSELNQLCRMVFKKDPKTNGPTGVLDVYMSDSVDPRIREFIKMNFLGGNQPSALPSTDPRFKDISDEDIADLTRNRNETQREYVARVNNWIEQRHVEYENARNS